MDEQLKQEHLNFKHKGKEEEFAKQGCILCQNYINAKKDGNLEGKSLDAVVRENISSEDVFGKQYANIRICGIITMDIVDISYIRQHYIWIILFILKVCMKNKILEIRVYDTLNIKDEVKTSPQGKFKLNFAYILVNHIGFSYLKQYFGMVSNIRPPSINYLLKYFITSKSTCIL